MSTKIFDGRKINTDLTVSQLFAKTQAVEAKCKVRINTLVEKLIANKLTYIIDYSYNFDKNINWLEYFFISNEVDHSLYRHNKLIHLFLLDVLQDKRYNILKTGGRDPEYDFDLSISFFGLTDKILYITNTEQSELIKIIDEELEGVDYSYWNNIDPPEDISEVEWQQRAEDWRVIEEQSLKFNLYNNFDYLTHVETDTHLLENIEYYIPSNYERAKRIAYSELINSYVHKKLSSNSRPSEVMRLSKQAHKYYNETNKGVIELEELKQQLHILPIDQDSLYNFQMEDGKFCIK